MDDRIVVKKRRFDESTNTSVMLVAFSIVVNGTIIVRFSVWSISIIKLFLLIMP